MDTKARVQVLKTDFFTQPIEMFHYSDYHFINGNFKTATISDGRKRNYDARERLRQKIQTRH